MTPSEIAEVASRVCTACGLCCNGVLFEIVRLQPDDRAEELVALGMRLGRRKRDPYFKQPCGFLEGCSCSIYAARPGRCRLFECRQLRRLADREACEDEVMRVIGEVKGKVAGVEAILEGLGNTSAHLPLSERCEEVLESPRLRESSMEPVSLQLAGEVKALNALLDEGFRTRPGVEAL